MPSYDYACITCDISQEITRSFKDEEVKPACPVCGYSMTRVYNAKNVPGVQFKGSGFYKTDNG